MMHYSNWMFLVDNDLPPCNLEKYNYTETLVVIGIFFFFFCWKPNLRDLLISPSSSEDSLIFMPFLWIKSCLSFLLLHRMLDTAFYPMKFKSNVCFSPKSCLQNLSLLFLLSCSAVFWCFRNSICTTELKTDKRTIGFFFHSPFEIWFREFLLKILSSMSHHYQTVT